MTWYSVIRFIAIFIAANSFKELFWNLRSWVILSACNFIVSLLLEVCIFLAISYWASVCNLCANIIDLLLPCPEELDDCSDELLVEVNVSSVSTLLFSNPCAKIESSVLCASCDKLSNSFNVLLLVFKSLSE